MHFLRIPGLLITLMLLSCSQHTTQSDKEEIEQFLHNNAISYIESSGVYIHFEQQGSEIFPTEESTVEISYTATYLNGNVFDKSPDGETVKLNLQDAINGLSIGLKYVSKGGTVSIYIPPSLGYGANPPFGVRKNAILVYHIHLVDIFG